MRRAAPLNPLARRADGQPMRNPACIVLLGLLVSAPAPADVETVSPINTAPTLVEPLVWGEANVRTGAYIELTSSQPRGDGLTGSIEMGTLPAPITPGQDKADFEVFWDDDSRTLGSLTSLSFEWYRDAASTVPAHLTPVLRLYFENTQGETGLLIWERVYQVGGAAPTASWQSEDILGEFFWMRAFDPGRTIDLYSVDLATWIASGALSDGVDTAWELDADTRIVGINVGFGSGWSDGTTTFRGFVDNVTVGFGGEETTWDFESEPTSLLCPFEPDVCTMGTVPGKARLKLKNHPLEDKRDLEKWAARKLAATDPGELGDPTDATDYELCVWTEVDDVPTLLLHHEAPAGGGWKERRRGFVYKAGKDVNPDGLRRILIKSGEEGKARILVRGKGAGLGMPELPIPEGAPVHAQLHNSDGACWGAAYTGEPRKNDERRFVHPGD